MLPMGAYAYRNSPGTCDDKIDVPSGYCCIEYYDSETDSLDAHMWDCDNLKASDSTKAKCKQQRNQCIAFCYTYDLDNDTCMDVSCSGNTVKSVIDSEDCGDENATLCDYDWVCPKCGGTCHIENEKVYECREHYYVGIDFNGCHRCPGKGVVDYDKGNEGITTCYIPRSEPLSDTDETGTFKYVYDKCYYKE